MPEIFNLNKELEIAGCDYHSALDYVLKNPIKNAFAISNLTQLRQDCSLVIQKTLTDEYAIAGYYKDLPYYNVTLTVNSEEDLRGLIAELTHRHREFIGQPIYGLYDQKTTGLLERFYETNRRGEELMMLLKRRDIPEIQLNESVYRLATLTDKDLSSISKLYEKVPAMDWTPKLLELGPYCGAYYKEELVSIAGVQFATRWVAEIGNIYTHPDHRQQNLAYICTREVVERLRPACDNIILCVDSGNPAAIRLYEKMGFELIERLNLVRLYIE